MSDCTLPHQHSEGRLIDSLKTELEKEDQFFTVAEIFKRLGDPTRVRIFWLLSHQEECVINISAMLNMSSPAVSHHLRSLHECGLLASRRCGKEVYYKTSDTEVCRHLHEMVEQVMEITCPDKQMNRQLTPEEIVHIVHEHLLDHLDVRTTIEELSRQFLMNPTTLKKTFKKVYGSSIAAHMNEHRMEQAAKLLAYSDDSIAQISQTVGYESQSRFSSVFKMTYGMSPSEYRKLHMKSKSFR